MKAFSKKTWMASVLASPHRHVVPIMGFPGVELCRMNAAEAFQSGDKELECMAAQANRFPLEFALTFMDLSIEAEAFGAPVVFGNAEPPAVKAPLIADAEEIEKITVPHIADMPGRIGEVLHCVKRAAGELAIPVLAGMIGPYSLACRLADMTEVMMMSIAEPEALHALLSKATDFLLEYAEALHAAGAAGLMIAEPAAGLIAPEACGEFSSNYIKKIVQAVAGDDFMVILHNCGHAHKQTAQLAASGADALHVGNAADLMSVLREAPPSLPVMGNLDPVAVFKNSSAEAVYAQTWDLLKKTEAFPNFVLSSGCDLPPGVPPENLDAFFRALAEFNQASK